jgi:hypothetical protein
MDGQPTRVRFRAILLESATLGALAVLALWLPWARASEPTDAKADTLAKQAEDQAIELRSASIEDDLKRMSRHPWAGSYYEGDGLGANVTVRVSPVSGVVATWDGCLGRYGQNEGQIRTESDGSLHFAYNLPNERGFGGFPGDVYPLNWSGRRYLIPTDKLGEFVAAINQGHEPRASSWGRFLLADDDEYKTVNSLPPLPAAYRERIRSQPVRAKVVGVNLVSEKPGYEKTCRKYYRLDLEVENNASLASGEILASTRRDDYATGNLTIETANPGSAVGIVDVFEDDCAKPKAVPKAGWAFSTGAYDQAKANKAINEAAKEHRSRQE